MKKLLAIALAATALASSATQYSCLSIITETKAIGRWDALKAWITSAGLYDEWEKCNYVSDDYPQYATLTNAIVAAGVVTDEQIRTILAKSVDTAMPDSMLMAMYRREMSNDTGRVRWHGKVRRTSYDTNALVKTQIYEDGYVHKSDFRTASPGTVEDQIASAARRDAMKRRAAELEKARQKARQDRIDYLTTNLVAAASELAAEKGYPDELATLLLQHELNTLKGTNVVNAVITPVRSPRPRALRSR